MIPGKIELEALYSAARKANLSAEQHERLRVLAQTVLTILEQEAKDRAVPEAAEAAPAEDAG